MLCTNGLFENLPKLAISCRTLTAFFFTWISYYLSDYSHAEAARKIVIFMLHLLHSCGLLTSSDSEKMHLMTNCNWTLINRLQDEVIFEGSKPPFSYCEILDRHNSGAEKSSSYWMSGRVDLYFSRRQRDGTTEACFNLLQTCFFQRFIAKKVAQLVRGQVTVVSHSKIE
jgi:hypothetical protein